MDVTFIPPKSIFDVNKFSRLHQAHMRIIAVKVENEFRSTVRSWSSKNRPKFRVKKTRDEIIVSTDSDLYSLVDAGSPPHPIFPRKAKHLVFQNKYKAKTSARIIGSTSGGKSGIVVYAASIERHPGFLARQFVQVIKEKNDLEFFNGADRVIAEANA